MSKATVVCDTGYCWNVYIMKTPAAIVLTTLFDTNPVDMNNDGNVTKTRCCHIVFRYFALLVLSLCLTNYACFCIRVSVRWFPERGRLGTATCWAVFPTVGAQGRMMHEPGVTTPDTGPRFLSSPVYLGPLIFLGMLHGAGLLQGACRGGGVRSMWRRRLVDGCDQPQQMQSQQATTLRSTSIWHRSDT